MQLTKTASDYFKEGYNCSQSVFAAFAAELGLPEETALKIAAPFGGGMGRRGQACGAVTGALMALGLHSGHTRPGDPAAKEGSYEMARQLASRFQELHGALTCPGLLGCDIGTPEGARQSREQNLSKERCPVFVRDAAQIVASMLDSDP